MSIAGNLLISTVKIPLLGRVAFSLDFTPLDITSRTINVYILPHNDAALTEALITHLGTDVKISATGVEIDLSSIEAGLLNAQKLYTLVVTIADASTLEVLYTSLAYLLPMRNAFASAYTATSMQPVLNAAVINRLAITAYAGGTSGCLDFITTADKSLGTIIEFVLTPGAQPEQWILEAGTTATDPGAIQQGTDYNASTNARYWRRGM